MTFVLHLAGGLAIALTLNACIAATAVRTGAGLAGAAVSTGVGVTGEVAEGAVGLALPGNGDEDADSDD